VDATANALHAGTLRYPGGNLADWWDWKTGWCIDNTTAPGCPKCNNPCRKKSKKRTYFLHEFKVALTASNANAVLMVNMLTLTLQDQLKYLAHAESIGVLVSGTYVELGGVRQSKQC
jgi:alpha-L-arabinofuranosidase